MAFCARYLHMQPSEFGALSNKRTGELVEATQKLLKAESEERWAMLEIQVKAALRRPF
jgi:hypothetical protein